MGTFRQWTVWLRCPQGRNLRDAGAQWCGQDNDSRDCGGLRSADEGSVTVLGNNVSKDRNCHKQDIGVQLQTTALFPELTVREVLSLFGSFYDRSLSPDELIEMVDLGEKRNARTANCPEGQRSD